MVGTALISPWKKDFPALALPVNGKRLAFLDSGASAQKPQVVLDTLRGVLGGAYANIHRGLYHNSAVTTALFEAARETVAEFFQADVNGVIFTSSSTAAINLVAHTFPFEEGDGIIISALEHHANIVPWQLLQERVKGLRLHVVPTDADGGITVANFLNVLGEARAAGGVRMVAMTQMSNVTGVRPPLEDIIPMAKAAGAVVLVDGSQGAVHGPQNLRELGADFYVMTGHKLYGPTGIGVLWARPELLGRMRPWMGGGDMIKEVSFAGTTYADGVARFEAGTPPIAEAIGLAAAMEYVRHIGWEAIAAHEEALAVYLDKALDGVPGLVRYGRAGRGHGIASFNLEGCHPHDVATLLDQQGIAVRSGHHCAMPLHAVMQVPGTLRASLGLYSESADVDQLVAGLTKAREMLG